MIIRVSFLLVILIFTFFLSWKINSQPEKLKQKFFDQSGKEQIETGLEICDSLVDSPSDLLHFSLELLDKTQKIVPNTLLLAKVNRAVSDGYYYSDSISQSNEYMSIAVSIAESLTPPDTQFLGGVYNDLGLNYLDSGEKNKARIYFSKSLQYLEGSPYLFELADTKSNFGIMLHSEGKYEEAIEMFQDAYQIDLKTGLKSKQSSSLNTLGRIYVDWGKYQTGLEYYFRSLALLDTINDKRTLGIRLNNIGMVYQLMNNHQEAIKWIERAKNIDEMEGSSIRLGIRFCNLGNSYMALKNYSKAQLYLEKAKSLFSNSEQYSMSSKIYGSLGQLYMETGQFVNAEAYLLQSLELAEKGGLLPEKSLAYKLLYDFYKNNNQFKEALRFFEMYSVIEDSVYNLKVARQVEEMEAQYLNKQKEAEITKLEKENEFTRNEMNFRKKERNWALVGVALLFIFSGSMYFLFSTVNRQKQKLVQQNLELERLNQTLNRLFAIISHDLRNATAAYQSSAKVIQHHLSKGHPEKLLPLAPELDANAQMLSLLLENLLQWSSSQIKGITPQKKLLDARVEVDKIIFLQKNRAEQKENKIIIEGNGNVWCDPGSFGIIIRNIIGNAIKFTANGTINIKITEDHIFTTFIISDTGRGIPQELICKIFRFGENKVRSGTSGEKGFGLGLPMVAGHVEKNGGKINVESIENSGTTFYISLPSKEI